MIDVRQFGAKGNGKHDDTGAIVEALAVSAAADRSSVYFPSGKYLFRTIDAEVSDLELHGDGATLVSSLPLGTPHPAIWLRGKRLWVHDIALDYVDPLDILHPGTVESRKPNAYGLRLGGRRDAPRWNAQQVDVERVSVSHARGGGIQVSYADHVAVRDCAIRQVLGNGLGFDGCRTDVVAERNRIHYAGDDLLVIVTDSSVPGGTRNVVFRENTVSHGFAKGIASSGVDGMKIEGNCVSHTYAGGITIFADTYYRLGRSNNVVIAKNRVRKAGHFFGPALFRKEASSVGDSIYIGAGSANVKVTDNELAGSIRDGIVATTISGLTISRNHVGGHPGVGILVGDPTKTDTSRIRNFEVTSNVLSGNRDGIAIGSASRGTVGGNTVALADRSMGRTMIHDHIEQVSFK